MKPTTVTYLVAAVILVALGAVLAWWLKPDAAPTTTPPPPGATVAVTPLQPQAPAGTRSAAMPGGSVATPSPTDTAASQAGARGRWMGTAVGFGRAFPVGSKTATQWQAGLAPYVTDTLARKLADVDIRNVPEGRYTDAEPIGYGETDVTVQVDYRAKNGGWALVLRVVSTDQGATWRVAEYDRQDLG